MMGAALGPANGLPLSLNRNVGPALHLKQPLPIVGFWALPVHTAEQFRFALAPSPLAAKGAERESLGKFLLDQPPAGRYLDATPLPLR